MMKTLVLTWIMLSGALNAALAAPVCPVKTIHNQGPYIKFGTFTGHLISPDDPDSSSAWEGPLVISQPSGKTCTVRTGIFAPPFFMAGSHFLYVTIFSGSEANQLLVDARTCNVPWISPQFVGDPRLANGNTFTYREAKPVKIGANCLPVGVAKPR